ncbi:MAG: type II secretion system protein [Burkholderiales bacterium]
MKLPRKAALDSPGARAGFTIIELVVTIAIIGVLTSVALPLAELSIRRAKESELRQSLRQIRTAIDEYKKAADEGRVERKSDETGYPPTLDVLVAGADNPKDPNRKKTYFLRRLPRDPFAAEPSLQPGQTWGLRSYQSSAESPQPGRDVYDVYSRAAGLGLNGVPYREW